MMIPLMMQKILQGSLGTDNTPDLTQALKSIFIMHVV
jgi:hypothetical protein